MWCCWFSHKTNYPCNPQKPPIPALEIFIQNMCHSPSFCQLKIRFIFLGNQGLNVRVDSDNFHHLHAPSPCSMVSKKHFCNNRVNAHNCLCAQSVEDGITYGLFRAVREMPSYKRSLGVDDRKTSWGSLVFDKGDLDFIAPIPIFLGNLWLCREEKILFLIFKFHHRQWSACYLLGAKYCLQPVSGGKQAGSSVRALSFLSAWTGLTPSFFFSQVL